MGGRDPRFGDALWVTPDARPISIDEEHPEWLREYGKLFYDFADWELFDDDANYNAIRKGWTRVVLFRGGESTLIAARDMETAKKAYRSLVRLNWSKCGANCEINLDIYGDDPNTPDFTRLTHPEIRRWMQSA